MKSYDFLHARGTTIENDCKRQCVYCGRAHGHAYTCPQYVCEAKRKRTSSSDMSVGLSEMERWTEHEGDKRSRIHTYSRQKKETSRIRNFLSLSIPIRSEWIRFCRNSWCGRRSSLSIQRAVQLLIRPTAAKCWICLVFASQRSYVCFLHSQSTQRPAYTKTKAIITKRKPDNVKQKQL